MKVTCRVCSESIETVTSADALLLQHDSHRSCRLVKRARVFAAITKVPFTVLQVVDFQVLQRAY